MNAKPDLDQLRGDMLAIFRRVFANERFVINDTMTAADIVGWDSIGHINLILAVEKKFKVKFTTDQITGLKEDGQNIGTFLLLVQEKIGSKL